MVIALSGRTRARKMYAKHRTFLRNTIKPVFNIENESVPKCRMRLETFKCVINYDLINRYRRFGVPHTRRIEFRIEKK